MTLIFVLLMNANFDLFSFKSLKTGKPDTLLRTLLLVLNLNLPVEGGFISVGLFVFKFDKQQSF